MTRWYQEKKHEHFYKQAKRVGYRSRSAFKLQQIQKRFNIFTANDTVVDLGGAPGGWSQIALKYIQPHGKILAIDLEPIKHLEQVTTIQGDITDPTIQEKIISWLDEKNADVVISDMSPDISGNYSLDQARSAWLSNQALTIASKILTSNGKFVCKIFEGEDTAEVLSNIKHRFYIVKKFSPEASRKSSSEIYIVAKSLKKQDK